MNTDNMSILGLTIDYGPFQFLDGYNPGHICNHSDHQGRYAFNKQPNIAYWNLYCLGQALLPLIEEQELAIAALESYKTQFPQTFERLMRTKMGLADVQDGDRGPDRGHAEAAGQRTGGLHRFPGAALAIGSPRPTPRTPRRATCSWTVTPSTAGRRATCNTSAPMPAWQPAA